MRIGMRIDVGISVRIGVGIGTVGAAAMIQSAQYSATTRAILLNRPTAAATKPTSAFLWRMWENS
jgi:hypothetical protein